MIHSVLAKEGDQPVHQCQGLLALRLVEEEHMLLAGGLQPLHRAAPPTLLFFYGNRRIYIKRVKVKTEVQTRRNKRNRTKEKEKKKKEKQVNPKKLHLQS